MKIRYLVTVLVAAALPIAAVIAQDSATQPTAQKEEQSLGSTGKDQMMCQNWSQQDAELDQLISAMNSASPDKKLDAIAAVVAKLAEQRKASHEQMAKMMSADEKTGMTMCQMMMGVNMKDDEERRKGEEHSSHHSE